MRKHGFTLIELLVVIAIIAILAAILFPVFARAREKAMQSACLSHQKQLGTAVMMYLTDYDQTYPPSHEGRDTYIPNWAERIFPYVKNLEVYTCPAMKISYEVLRRWFNTSRADADRRARLYGIRNYSANAYVLGWLGEDPASAHGPARVRREAELPESANTIMLNECVGTGTVLVPNRQTDPPAEWWWAISDECWPCAETGRDPDLLENFWTSMLLHSQGANYTMADGHAKWYRPSQTVQPLRCEGANEIGNLWQWDLLTMGRCVQTDCPVLIQSIRNVCR